MDIRGLEGNCQDPVRCVGSWILSPNRTFGVAVLRPFRSKTGQPSFSGECSPDPEFVFVPVGAWDSGVL